MITRHRDTLCRACRRAKQVSTNQKRAPILSANHGPYPALSASANRLRLQLIRSSQARRTQESRTSLRSELPSRMYLLSIYPKRQSGKHSLHDNHHRSFYCTINASLIRHRGRFPPSFETERTSDPYSNFELGPSCVNGFGGAMWNVTANHAMR